MNLYKIFIKLKACDAISQRMMNSGNNNEFNILDLMTKTDIYQLKTAILSGLHENILKFGAYAGVLISTIFIMQLIK